jgi:hypothetical protein
MDWIAEAVETFGQTMGMHGLRLDAQGCISLSFEGGTLLTLRDLGGEGIDEVLVIVRAGLSIPRAAGARVALRLADFRVTPGQAPQLAVEGDDLVATLRIPRHSFIASTLEEALDELFAFHERASRMETMR